MHAAGGLPDGWRRDRLDAVQGGGGQPYFVRLADGDAWVAVIATGGGGGGWFRADDTLDPATSDWEAVDVSRVLTWASDDCDQIVQLTAAMITSCIVDNFTTEALAMADTLIDHGFEIVVSVRPHVAA